MTNLFPKSNPLKPQKKKILALKSSWFGLRFTNASVATQSMVFETNLKISFALEIILNVTFFKISKYYWVVHDLLFYMLTSQKQLTFKTWQVSGRVR